MQLKAINNPNLPHSTFILKYFFEWKILTINSIRYEAKVEKLAAWSPITLIKTKLMTILDKAYEGVNNGEFTQKIYPLDGRTFYKAK